MTFISKLSKILWIRVMFQGNIVSIFLVGTFFDNGRVKYHYPFEL